MKKSLFIIALASATALVLSGCNVKTQIDPNSSEIVSEIASVIESEVDSEIASEIDSELVEGNVTPAIDAAMDDFASLMDAFDEDAYIGFVDLDGTNVLLQGVLTFEDDENNVFATNATCFVIKDGAPTFCGELKSGGTAYPIAVNGKYLYTGNHQGFSKYSFNSDMYLIEEEADGEEIEETNDVMFFKRDMLQ